MTNDFSYSVFDRQMEHLLGMSRMLVEGWDDHATTELDCDLYSLRTKAARLCCMADEDFIRQQDDLAQMRRTENADYATRLQNFVYACLVPLLRRLVGETRHRHLAEHPKLPTFPLEVDTMAQRLLPLLQQDGMQQEAQDNLFAQLAEQEELLRKKVKTANYPAMTQAERMHHLLQYFMLMCYLMFHFQRISALTDVKLTDDEAGRMLLNMLQQYKESGRGSAMLQRYRATLLFDNDNLPLSLDQLREARKALRKDVPECMQMAFMQHVSDVEALARDILDVEPPVEDFLAFLDVVARWQMLTADMFAIEHPEGVEPRLPNAIFHTVLHDRPIDLVALRDKLRRLLPLITRKNEWFCLWCVLRHRGLLKDESAEAFAQQIQTPEWLAGCIPQTLTFSGDTLRTYSGYLNQVDFTRWDKKDFCLIRSRLKKEKKWGDKLFNNFQRLCYKLDEGW